MADVVKGVNNSPSQGYQKKAQTPQESFDPIDGEVKGSDKTLTDNKEPHLQRDRVDLSPEAMEILKKTRADAQEKQP